LLLDTGAGDDGGSEVEVGAVYATVAAMMRLLL